MSKSNVQYWSDEDFIKNLRQWEVSSVQDMNQYANIPIDNFSITSHLIKGLSDDNRFLLGVVAELARRALPHNQELDK